MIDSFFREKESAPSPSSPPSRHLRVRQHVRRRLDDGGLIVRVPGLGLDVASRSADVYRPAADVRLVQPRRGVRQEFRTKLHKPERLRGVDVHAQHRRTELGELGEQPRQGFVEERSQHRVHARCEVSDVYLPLLLRGRRLFRRRRRKAAFPHLTRAHRTSSGLELLALELAHRRGELVVAGVAPPVRRPRPRSPGPHGGGARAVARGQKLALVTRRRSEKACG